MGGLDVKRLVGLVLVLPLVLAFAGPAAAYQVVSETGLLGEYIFEDYAEKPGGWCGYTQQEYPPNYAYFRWMKIRRPIVRAADRTSGQIDQRKVRWFWHLQRSTYPSGNWTTIATSAKQTKIAYENQAAAFTPLRIDRNVGTTHQAGVVFRALVVIQFLRPNGSVEGTANATLDWYRYNSPWGFTDHGNGFCERTATSG